jgi:hypothetical protein
MPHDIAASPSRSISRLRIMHAVAPPASPTCPRSAQSNGNSWSCGQLLVGHGTNQICSRNPDVIKNQLCSW